MEQVYSLYGGRRSLLDFCVERTTFQLILFLSRQDSDESSPEIGKGGRENANLLVMQLQRE